MNNHWLDRKIVRGIVNQGRLLADASVSLRLGDMRVEQDENGIWHIEYKFIVSKADEGGE